MGFDDLRWNLEGHFKNIINLLRHESDICTDDRHLDDTPRRLAEAFAYDYFSGLWKNPDDIFNKGVFQQAVDDNVDQMILLKNIDFVSLCVHHFLPFVGHVHVAYLPNQKLVGLSKIPRIVEVLSRRPQVQERLTQQLADCLVKNLVPFGCGVVIDAEHQCMACRGVRKSGIVTRTSALRGTFLDQKVKQEFFMGISG